MKGYFAIENASKIAAISCFILFDIENIAYLINGIHIIAKSDFFLALNGKKTS